MTTVTLEQVQAEHKRLADLIAQLQTSATTEVCIAGVTITLAPGEHYAGLVLGANGQPSYHLVLLPGEAESVTWEQAKTWADAGEGELPTRQEQALLFANLKREFQPTWYWSGEQHEDDSSYAWYQGFYYGTQSTYRKSYAGRARAVRRFAA